MGERAKFGEPGDWVAPASTGWYKSSFIEHNLYVGKSSQKLFMFDAKNPLGINHHLKEKKDVGGT